jgi:hypothetical protein
LKPPATLGGAKFAVACGGPEKKLHFCSTNHLPGNKISLPALPGFNAGKLLFYGLHFTGCPPWVFSAMEQGGQFNVAAKKMRVMTSPPRSFPPGRCKYHRHTAGRGEGVHIRRPVIRVRRCPADGDWKRESPHVVSYSHRVGMWCSNEADGEVERVRVLSGGCG